MQHSNHILIAHVVYKLDFGGLENGLVNLINMMPSNRFNHVIICLTDYTDFSKKLKKEVPIFSLHKKEGKDIGLYFKLYKIFRKIKPDIVHTRNMATLESLLPAFLAGVKIRVHGEHGRDVHDLDGMSIKFRLLRKLFRPLVDRYIPLSDELEKYLLENINVPENKIMHICNGVDLNKHNPSKIKKDVLPEKFSNSDSIIVGTIGRMEEVKDQENLATAFISIVSGDAKMKKMLRLIMIGDGSLRNTIKMKLDRENCTEISWLPGARKDIPELLREIDIFVLPSRAEGISNTILEAMASGIPVVATNVGGNSELVVEGETGFLVPRNDPEAMKCAIRKYIDDPELRAMHARNARNRAEKNFDINIMVNQYKKLYETVLNKRVHIYTR